MAQFGWPTLIKTAAITAVVTSGLWASAGMVWYYRVGPGHVAADRANPQEAAGQLVPMVSPVAPATHEALDPAALVAANQAMPSTLLMPVKGVTAAQLVDTFTQSRAEGRVHEAIDIMAPRGTPVIAAAAGTVEKLHFSAQGGITVYVRSPDRRLLYYYAHLDSYAPGLAEGQVLAVGAPLGLVGFSGNASPDGPHLHFAISAIAPDQQWYQPAVPLNPYPLLRGKPG
ncbi:M23 family metallopeptidase [Novosphingobium aquiterrae]|uniref:M23 family metallopeptidase n=1 Tax=Novosphingobium aquiterrae TaxID=624388 RepID=A0ABV6PES7_9SPHN